MAPKQYIYCWLIHHGFVVLRGLQSAAGWSSRWRLFWDRKPFRYGTALANLLHRLDQTVTEPDFNERDLTFINHAIPRFLEQAGAQADRSLLAMLVQLYDVVPDHQRGLLTWHPGPELRRLAEERLGGSPPPSAPAADVQ